MAGFGSTVQQAAQPAPEPVLPDVDYLAAAEGYVVQRGHFPNAEQFGVFLAQYGIVADSTRKPLPGILLEPVLDELWGEHHERFIQRGQAPMSAENIPPGSGSGSEVGELPVPGAGPAPGSAPSRRHPWKRRRRTSWKTRKARRERLGTLHPMTSVPVPAPHMLQRYLEERLPPERGRGAASYRCGSRKARRPTARRPVPTTYSPIGTSRRGGNRRRSQELNWWRLATWNPPPRSLPGPPACSPRCSPRHGLHRWNGAQVPGRHQARRTTGHRSQMRNSSLHPHRRQISEVPAPAGRAACSW